jgi:hypothetical protein
LRLIRKFPKVEADYRQDVEFYSCVLGTASVAIEEYTQAVFAAAPIQAFVPPQADEREWLGVKRYLTQALGLPSGLVDQLHRQGLVYAGQDRKGVFLMRDLDN